MRFALYGSWEGLVGGKILVQGVGTICPPGKHHSGRKKSLDFLLTLMKGAKMHLGHAPACPARRPDSAATTQSAAVRTYTPGRL